MHFSIDRTVHTTAFDKPVVDHWLERKILLEESKPYNEMEIFKTFVKQRIKMEHFVASENEGKRENCLRYWCYEGILATCTDAFELNFCL